MNNQIKDGYGEMYYANGHLYKGYFKDGKYNGWGFYTDTHDEF